MSQGLPGHHADPHAVLRARAQQLKMQAPVVDAPVASPCVSVCRLDASLQHCEGCLRTLDEIRLWPTMDTARRLAVWQCIEARLNPLQETPAP